MTRRSDRSTADTDPMQTVRMEAIARVAGGVAHDFNNILTSIIGAADLSLSVDGVPAEVRADLESIRTEGRRAAALTRQMLTFSRQQVAHPRLLDLKEIIQSAEPLMRRLVPESVRIEFDVAAKGAVNADAMQLEQALISLVTNAGEAMPNGGTLTIGTADVELGEAVAVNGRRLSPGSYLVLRVRDTGTGMDEATQERLFEPFFTTKAPGRGLGLGLATVQRIALQSGGAVLAHSTLGEGSRFELYLPCADAAAQPRPASTSRGGMEGTETVLVVEDESPVRTTVCRALRGMGYEVLEAQNGEDALAVLQEHHAPIQLLVTDLVMPEMGGSELGRLLHEWYPGIRMLFISGFSAESATSDESLIRQASYLPKPFTVKQLGESVRELLDRPL